MKYLTAVILLFGPICALVAQNEKLPPLPPGPLPANPDYAKWEVDISDPARKSQPGADGRPKQPQNYGATITKTGNIRYEVIVEADGDQLVKWCDGRLQWFKRPLWPKAVLWTAPNVANPYYVSYERSTFPELSWVSPKNYSGVKEVMGRKCLVFNERIQAFSSDELGELRLATKRNGKPFDPDDYKVSATACIDFETRLPIQFDKGTEIHVYRFFPTPTSMLQLPPEIEEQKRAEEQLQKDYARRPAAS
jgi:hypothetical protein